MNCQHVLVYYYNNSGKLIHRCIAVHAKNVIGVCVYCHQKIKVVCHDSLSCYRQHDYCHCKHKRVQDYHCVECGREIKECPMNFKDFKHVIIKKEERCKHCGLSVCPQCKKMASFSCATCQSEVQTEDHYQCDCGAIGLLAEFENITFCLQCGKEGVSRRSKKPYNK